MTEIEEIYKDLKDVVDRFNKWYNENITSVHHLHTYPYIAIKIRLGQSITYMGSIVYREEAKKK